MARANRLLITGGVVTLLGAALVLVVLLMQRSDAPPGGSSAPTVQIEDPATPVAAAQNAAPAPVELTIPEGMEAVSLTVDFQRAVAGLVSAGDRVNVYGVFTNRPGDLVDEVPSVRRVLADVEVLAVTGAAFTSNGGTPTVVLALSGEDVERALYTHVAESVFLTLVDGDEASAPTSGASAGSLAP